MRQLRFAAAILLALPACSPAVRPAPPVTAAPALRADIVTATARSFAAAEIEWQSAIAVGRSLVAHRVIRGATATTVRGWNAEARKLIVRGKATVDAAEQARAAADLLALAGKLDAITGRK